MNRQKNIETLLEKKKKGERIIMLTAYDFPLASIVERCGVDIILVGDTLANVVLGLERTAEVSMEEMLHHARAVNRAIKKTFLVCDMPYVAYQQDIDGSVDNAKRFVDEAGAQAVKLEWFDRCLEVASRIINAGIPVMGHVGLTPQTADKLGGLKVQGKDAQSAQVIIEQAKQLESAGCFSIVLECIPDGVAKIITESLSIPTIGIGAGVQCDGQVLVTYDLLGFENKFQPKFTKEYARLSATIEKAINQFSREVKEGRFPDDAHSYHINEAHLRQLKGGKS